MSNQDVFKVGDRIEVFNRTHRVWRPAIIDEIKPIMTGPNAGSFWLSWQGLNGPESRPLGSVMCEPHFTYWHLEGYVRVPESEDT